MESWTNIQKTTFLKVSNWELSKEIFITLFIRANMKY